MEGRRSNVSSSSGTIVSRLSTASASNSSGSCFSDFSMEAAALHFHSLDIRHNNMYMVRSLVQEFFSAPAPAPPANRSTKRGEMSVVERWLTELGVGWVLFLDPFQEEEEGFDWDAPTWIRALHQIAETIRHARPLFPDRGSVGLPNICVEAGGHLVGRCIQDRYHLALFIQEIILTMLTFVDVLVVWDPNMAQEFLAMEPVPCNKLSILLGVHDALSSLKMLTLFDRAASMEVKTIHKAMDDLLSAYQSKLGEATRSTLEQIRTELLEYGGSSTSLNPQGSSSIHNVTRSVITYVEFLLLRKNYSKVNAAIQDRVTYTEKINPVKNMIVEMMSSLQEKLVNISESFSDEGLQSLFLLNNSYYMQQSLESKYLREPIDLTQKIEGYMERYLQVSWAPLLSCLFNPTPLCFGKQYSVLSKFESEFQEICTTQIEWKIPDPKLRRRLRKVITDKIIPVYTEYIEDNKVTNPKISPQELKAMLQDLFEG